MKNKNIIKIMISLFIVFQNIPCLGQEYSNISSVGIHELKLRMNRNSSVNCYIKVVKYTQCMLHNRMYGSDWENPNTIIAEILIFVKKEKVIVPLSVYADLSNSNNAKLINIRSGYRLILMGGDGATSYKATIDFTEKQVILRKVQWMVSPNDAWQITIYSPLVDIE